MHATESFVHLPRMHISLAISSSVPAWPVIDHEMLRMSLQAIFEEMQAVGLHRPGGLMRQAFSLGDLTLLQPPNEVQGGLARTWSPGIPDAQAALYSHSELPELLSLPAHNPQQAL